MSWSAFITLTQPTYDGNENKTIIRRRERSVNEKSKLHLDEKFMLSSEKEREREIGKKIYVNLEVQMHASLHATVLIRQLKPRPKKD